MNEPIPTKNSILIHGWGTKDEFDDQKYPTASNSHWFPWLSKQLMIRGIHTVALEMPHSYNPEYYVWKKEIERFEVGPETILVGHSCGGGFLIRWLSENKHVRVSKVVLVAPWVGIDPDRPFYDKDFFNFECDKDLVSRTSGITIFNSLNDNQAIHKSVDVIRNKITDIKYCEFPDKGHFCKEELGGVEFPELLEEILV